MPNVTFPCPFCAKKMAVGADMLGKKVRCPSCKQVVVAPAEEVPLAAPVAVPPTPLPPPIMAPAPAPAPAPLDELPVFNFEQKESAESILSSPEESEDEVFGSVGSNKIPTPKLDDLPSAAPSPVDDNPFGFGDAAPPEPPRPPEVTKPAAPPPRAVEPPAPVAAPPRAAVAMDLPSEESAGDPLNPFSNFEAPAAAVPEPAVAPVAAAKPAQASPAAPAAEKPATAAPARRPARAVPAGAAKAGFGAPFYLLLLYAVIMTGLAVYGFAFRYGTQIDPGHPLSAIPDNFGEFPTSERRKQGQMKNLPDAPMPPELRVALRKKLELGPLEIEPIKVAIRRLDVVTVPKNGKPSESRRGEAVVMTLRIRNTSNDVTLHPMDPAFTRKFTGTTDEPKPGTTLEVGKEKFRGGPFSWPPSDRIASEYELAQKDDSAPLKPGDTREYVVCSAPESRIVRAVRDAPEPMLWRVQVRRGFVEIRGKDVPVTAIFGVEFRASDVQLGDN